MEWARLLHERKNTKGARRRLVDGFPQMEELERAKGFEPSTPTLARLCSTPELHPHAPSLASNPLAGWWSQAESNRRPLECHSSALPTELWPLTGIGIDHQSLWQADERFLKSGFLFVFAAFADDVGDIVVALFLLFDEGGLFGFLDLEIVVAFDGLALLLAGGFCVGVLKRDKLDVSGLRQFGFGLLGLRGGGSSRRC